MRYSYNMQIYIIIFLLLLPALEANPLKLTRFIDFSYTESINYNSNLFLADDNNNGSDVFLEHSLAIAHGQKRPWYEYALGYTFSYRNFLEDSGENFAAHNISGDISILRKYYQLSFAGSFAVTSQQQDNIEFDDFLVTYTRDFQFNGRYNVSPIWRIEVANGYEKTVFPDNEEEDSEIFRNSVNNFYQINDQVSLTMGGSYTIIAGEDREEFPGIDVGVNYNSKFPLVYWIDQASFRFGFTLNDNFENPLLFSFIFSGSITPATTWNITGTRDVTFSIIDEVQLQTNVSLGSTHTINQYWTAGGQWGLQHTELENENNLFGFNFAFFTNYVLTEWSSISVNYSISARDDGNDFFYQHSTSASWTIRF